MPDEPLLFIHCPFCGSHAAKIIKHGKRYYTRCMVCNARGPLANSENLAREFWNNAVASLSVRQEPRELPEGLKKEIEKIQSDYLNWDYHDWEYARYSNSEQFSLMKGEINHILNRIASLTKPEE